MRPKYTDMNICAIIPDRGDRPRFTTKCIDYLKRQTLVPHRIAIVRNEPESDSPDLTKRVRKAYEALKHQYDVFCVIENDDWYSHAYIETMAKEWDNAGRPDLFGSNTTTYYHILKDQHRRMEHPNRSSLFTTWIKGGQTIPWPSDDTLNLDVYLWGLPVRKVTTKTELAIGIKHGQGMCGGQGHTTLKYDKQGAPPLLEASEDIHWYWELDRDWETPKVHI